MMTEEKQFYIYIMTNKYNNVLYTGVTNDLERRITEHRIGKGGSFTKKYKLYKLVYYESIDDIEVAVQREKEKKGGSRKKKIELVNSINPEWEDLFKNILGDMLRIL
jgi:putative endonuclease